MLNYDEVVDRAVGSLGIERLEPASPGVLIAVEGIDDSGVGTVAYALASALRRLGARTCLTKEPTYGPIGFVVRQTLGGLGGPYTMLNDQRIAALLFAADRFWHLIGEPVCGRPGILSCIANGCIVVTDRYKYSSIVYQSTPIDLDGLRVPVEGAPNGWLWEINKFAPPAHILVYVDVDVETALERIYAERFSIQISERREYLERMRRLFKAMIDLLRIEAEYDPNDEESPPWERWVDIWAPGSSKAWLAIDRLARYPFIVEVGSSGSLEDTVTLVLRSVVKLLVEKFGFGKNEEGDDA